MNKLTHPRTFMALKDILIDESFSDTISPIPSYKSTKLLLSLMRDDKDAYLDILESSFSKHALDGLLNSDITYVDFRKVLLNVMYDEFHNGLSKLESEVKIELEQELEEAHGVKYKWGK